MILLFDIEMIEKLKLGINAWSCYLNREYKIREGSTYPLPVLFNNKLRETFSKGGLIRLSTKLYWVHARIHCLMDA